MTTLISRLFCALLLGLAAFGATAQTADLSVTQTPPDVVYVGERNRMVVAVANNGTDTTNATVTYSGVGGLPNRASGTGWTCQAPAGNQIVCTYANLVSGASAPALTVEVQQTDLTFTSRAVVSSAPATDPNAANDTAEATYEAKYSTHINLSTHPTSPSAEGTSITVTAYVSRNYPYVCTPCSSGTVTFLKEGIAIGTAALVNGRASLTVSGLSIGSHYFRAQYSGATNYEASETWGTTPHDVLRATSTTITTAPSPSEYGETVVMTVNVTSSSGTPTGYVSFMYGGGYVFGRVALSNGVATGRLPTQWTPRNVTITAAYEGSTAHMASRGSVSHTIGTASTSTALTTSAATSSYGQSVKFTARVTSHYDPQGYVTFSRNGVAMFKAALSRGVAEYSVATLPPGSWQITAEYHGGTYHYGSTAPPVTQTVAKADTSAVLATSLNPSFFGQTVSYTATVTSATTRVTGPVQFYRAGTFIGTASLSGGVARLTTAASPAGAYPLHAIYAGNSNINGSTSNSISQTVEKTTTTTTLLSSLNPAVSRDPVVLTASVAGAYGGTATGTVTFKANGTPLRTVSLSRGTAVFTTSTLPVGTHSLTATYNDSPNLYSSTSEALTQVVKRRVDATITAPAAVCSTSIGNTASVPAQSGVTYNWTIVGGTITAGAGTNRITFSTSYDNYVTLTAELSCATCATATDSHVLQVGSGIAVGSRDLSGDGKNDLIWQNRSTGATSVWVMSGASLSAVVGVRAPGIGWWVEGVADVNRDGKADLIYRNPQTGAALAWLMNGLSNIGSMTFSAPVDAAWTVGGIADFNCDGYADVLWTNATTRENAIWLMNGNVVTDVVKISSMGSGWKVEGVGDFNIDGRADIVWRRTTDGRMAVWTMNSMAYTSTLYPPAQFDLNWSLKAIADYNSDGQADLVWRNATTGANEIWLMNGVARTSIVQLTPVYDPNMFIGGPK